ncbi:hypothetical protein [Clostridium perfringens]|uniref:hypothetical protein n=1 Tax=Clostridium perfringens TaxID=1502 RepID=UPI00096AAA26|nr:hypothetical protein [Clostridium perfringens]
MEERKITNIKLIDGNGKIEVEITKTIKEKVILDQNKLLKLTQGNQIKSSINSKDGIFGEIKSNYPKTTYDKVRYDDIDAAVYANNGLIESLRVNYQPIKLKIK